MNIKGLVVTVVAVALGATLLAQDQAREQKLQQAIDLLETKGDAARAMPLLEDVAKSADQSLAARGLLYLGQAQERQGNDQARRTYQRILRDYASQEQIAAQARARLGALATSPTQPANPTALLSTRHVWTAPDTYWYEGSVSDDGRTLSLVDWPRGGFDFVVYIQDLATLTTRKVVAGVGRGDAHSEQPESPLLSRDGKRLAYSWVIRSGQPAKAHNQVRVVDLDNVASPPRVLLDAPALAYVSPRAWSADGQRIAVDYAEADNVRKLGLISAIDGSLRSLKVLASRRQGSMAFSPDGRFLAFDFPEAGIEDRDIGAIDLSDGHEIAVVKYPGDDALIGWDPPGTHVVFSSLRSGTRGVWIAPRDRNSGSARLLKGDFSRTGDWLGITRTGALYYAPASGGSDVKSGAFDFAAGEFRSEPVDVAVDAIGATNAPRWSPDGKSLAYVVNKPGRKLIAIRSSETGRTATIDFPVNLRNGNHQLWRWAQDSTAFYAVGTDRAGRDGLFRLTVNGTLTLVVPKAPPSVGLPVEIDAETIRYHAGNVQGPIWERNIRTGAEKAVFSDRAGCNYYGGSKVFCLRNDVIVEHDFGSGAERRLREGAVRYWTVSPDARLLVTSRVASDLKSRVIDVLDLPSGGTREVLRLGAEEGFSIRAWAPDGRSVIAVTTFRSGEPGSDWWIPLDGRAPRKLTGLRGLDGELQVSPDGRTVAFGVRDPGKTELWVLENFLPTAPKK